MAEIKTKEEISGSEPVFACVGYGEGGNSFHQPGLTKREYFAAMAMQGLLASYAGCETKPAYDAIGALSTKYADALIEHLNKQTP